MTHAERMQLVKDDAESDAMKLDSTPFTPRGIGEQLGQIYASIKAIADTLQVICEREGL